MSHFEQTGYDRRLIDAHLLKNIHYQGFGLLSALIEQLASQQVHVRSLLGAGYKIAQQADILFVLF